MSTGTSERETDTTTVQDVLVGYSLRRLLVMAVLGVLFVVSGHQDLAAVATHAAAIGLAMSMVLRPPRAERIRAREQRRRWPVFEPRWNCSGRERESHAPFLRHRKRGAEADTVEQHRPG